MDYPYVYTRSVVRHQIPASTVVKVVLVATVTAYFARNLVKVVDQTFDAMVVTQQSQKDKEKK